MRGYIRLRKLKSPDGAKSWRIVAELPRDPVTGKRRQKHKSVRGAKKDAERELRRLIAEIESGRLASSGRQTVGEYLQRWLRDYAVPNVAAKTYVRYKGIVRVHLIPALGEIPLESLKPTDIQSILHVDYRAEHHLEFRRSCITIEFSSRLSSMPSAWELIVRNPADGAIPPRRTPSRGADAGCRAGVSTHQRGCSIRIRGASRLSVTYGHEASRDPGPQMGGY